jgi:hypothetical protein
MGKRKKRIDVFKMKMKNKQKKLHQQFKVNGPGRNDTLGVFFFQHQAVTGRGKKKKIEKMFLFLFRRQSRGCA